jgi:hypothetical protein
MLPILLREENTMRIEETRPDSVRSGQARPAAPVQPAQPARPVQDADSTGSVRVDISAEARALAASQSDAAPETLTLSPERLAELRRWVHAGGFDEPAVIASIARRLLENGEV